MMQQKKKLIFLWFTLSLCLFLLSMSVLNIMLLFWSFFAGVGLTIYIFSPGYEVNNLFPVFSIRKKGADAKSGESSNKCICGKDNCERQKPEKALESLQPWMGIKVTKKVNAAIEEFIDILLERHASNWYKKLSDDEAFILELKASIRHCFAVVYRRISKVDLPDFIVNSFVPISVNHISICLKARDEGHTSEDEIMSFYTSQLHYCLKSRRHELNYIRAMCDRILTLVCPDSLIESRIARVLIREVLASNVVLPGIDSIDNPDFVNNLLLLYFDDDPPAPAPGPPSPLVTLLERFSSREASLNRSLLHVDLEKILHTQDMLYQFMNFLKTRSAVHYLQFYLTVEDFHRRCLSQEQDDEQLKKLHCEAKEIFETYCRPDASSFIHFEPNIIQELQDISEGPWQEVTRLRTSTPLYRAFDHVYNMLEKVYCPLFYEDDTYYQMMCGDRVPTASKKAYPSASTLNKTAKKKFSRKFRPSRTDTDDGLGKSDMFLDNTSLGSDEFDKTSLLDDDSVIDEKFPSPNSNLSNWRLSIPHIKRKPTTDPSSSEIFLFCIEVVDLHRDGDGVEKWQVLRHHNEFYSLESKLTEFHGSLAPITLPPKKFFSKSLEYLDSRRQDFEKFLRELITSLHKSELLYDFLMPQRAGVVSRFNSRSGMAKVKLGNFIRRVPNKLIKEKGRHIDAFLQSFVTSCEASKPRPGKNGGSLKNCEVIMDQKLHSDMYSDGGGGWLWSEKNKDTVVDDSLFPYTPPKTPAFSGLFDCITLLCVRLFRIDRWLLQLLVVLRILFRRSIEPFVSRHLKKKIEVYKQEHHLVRLIHLFRDVIFFDKDPPRTEALKLERKAEVLRELKAFIPEQFAYLIGRDQHERSCQEFIDILQCPKLNKHLGYTLLDDLVTKLFPEIAIDEG